MSEAFELISLRGNLRKRHGDAAKALGLELEFLLPDPPPPVLPAELIGCLDSLLARALERTRDAASGGSLRLKVAPVAPEGTRLRAILEDPLPLEGSAGLFARLTGAGEAEEELSSELLRIIEPLQDETAAEIEFDLYGDASGSTFWYELPLPGGASMSANVTDRLRGWSRFPVFDREDTVRRMGGDEELVVIVLEAFHGETPNLLAELEEALEARDLERGRRMGHSLKGSAANGGAKMLSEVARAGDWAAKEGHLPVVTAVLPRMRWESERFERHCRVIQG